MSGRLKKNGIIKVEFVLLGRCVTDIMCDPSKRRCSSPKFAPQKSLWIMDELKWKQLAAAFQMNSREEEEDGTGAANHSWCNFQMCLTASTNIKYSHENKNSQNPECGYHDLSHLQHSLGAVHVPDLSLPHIDALSRVLRHKAAWRSATNHSN